MSESTFEGWAILELMGHRRVAGFLSIQEIGNTGFLRIDIPATEQRAAMTKFYAPAAIYAITPTTEEMARRVAAIVAPEPVSRWELQVAPTPASGSTDSDGDLDPPF